MAARIHSPSGPALETIKKNMPQESSVRNAEQTAPGKRQRRLSISVGLWIIKRIERLLTRLSRVPDQPWFDPSQFEWTRALEDNTPTIRVELDRLLKHPERIPNFQDISRDQAHLTSDRGWKTFFLRIYGYRIDGNCELCPETAKIVDAIPGIYTAVFSILAPRKHIPKHRGPYKGVLRCHLPVMVPERAEDCWIEVGGEARHWESGRCMVFDDTYRHRVENNTDEARVVLFLDVKRPMKAPGALLNNVVLGLIRRSPLIRDAVRNQAAWQAGIDRSDTGDG